MENWQDIESDRDTGVCSSGLEGWSKERAMHARHRESDMNVVDSDDCGVKVVR